MVKFVAYASCAIWRTNLQLMQVAPSGGQICNLCKWPHLVDKFAHNASGAILLLDLFKVMESISGFIVPLEMFSKLIENPKIVFLQCCAEKPGARSFSLSI